MLDTPQPITDGMAASSSVAMKGVAVVMCTYNGASYLDQQIESIIGQSHTNWKLYVSDDGSKDDTIAILQRHQANLGGRIQIFDGPKQGFAKNFLSLLARPEVQADYYAFCDQDDVWHQDKLDRSVQALIPFETSPALYCGRTRLVDANGRHIGFSPRFRRRPSFQNALVQSVAGANTMVMNNRGRSLLIDVDRNTEIVAHDWLAYLLITASAGMVIYDPDPSLDYRQHGHNIIGGNSTFRDRLGRLRLLWDGRFARWADANIIILRNFQERMSARNNTSLKLFCAARTTPFVGRRLRLLWQSGVYRQTTAGNCSLIIGSLIKRI